VRRALLALALLVSIGGCASFWEALGSKDAAAGCQLADVASTHYALHHNPNAVEENPIPVPALDVIKIALAGYIKYGISDEEWANTWLPIRVFVSAVGCGAAVNNIRVGNGH
jgi:uncharacterized protein YceK